MTLPSLGSQKDLSRIKVAIGETGASLRDAIDNVLEMTAMQNQAINRLKAPPPHQRSSVVATATPTTGNDGFAVACERRWNQELQVIVEDEKQNPSEKVSNVRRFMDDFAKAAAESFHELIHQYLSEDSTVSESIRWASETDKRDGQCLYYRLLDESEKPAKEIQQQFQFLSQQFLLFQHPFVTVYPQAIVYARGRSAVVSGQPLSVGAFNARQQEDFRFALDACGGMMNIAPYRWLLDDGTEEPVVGPLKAEIFRGNDGRMYVSRMLGWYPIFPPQRGCAATDSHALYFRTEFFTRVPESLSPGAFRVFGTRDSAAFGKVSRNAAKVLCQEIIPGLASEFLQNPPQTHHELIKRMHDAGVNLGLLGLMLLHCSASPKLRSMIVVEMVARSVRSHCRRELLSRIDEMDMHDEIARLCAGICSSESRQATWDEVVFPLLRLQFPGVQALIQPPLSANDLSPSQWLPRFQELMKIQFAPGVNANGTSSFHFSIEKVLSFSKPISFPNPVLTDVKSKESGIRALIDAKVVLDHSILDVEKINSFVSTLQRTYDNKSYGYGFGLYSIGVILAQREKFEESVVFLDKAIEIIECRKCDLLGYLYSWRGKVAARCGNLKDAVRNLSKAIAHFDVPDKGDFASVAIVLPMIELANLYEQKGLFEEAEPLWRRVRSLQLSLWGPKSREYSTALNNLAYNLFAQQNFFEAEELYKEDLAVTESLFHPNSTEVATCLNNLAAVLDAQQRSSEAEELYRRDLEISMSALGEDHLSVATSMNNLATCLQKLGKLSEAESLYEKALAIRKKHDGESSVAVADLVTNLGSLSLSLGDPLAAKRRFESALQVYESVVGRNHYSLRRVLEHLSNLCEALGDEEGCEMYSDWLMELKRADNEVYTAQQAAAKW